MSSIKLHLSTSDILLIKGFAIIECYNDAYILGINVKGKTINIRGNKSLPVEPAEECDISIRLGTSGRYMIMKRECIGTSIWDDIRDAVLFKQADTIMIVGANDTGKSTLALYLTNLLLDKRKSIFMIDGDVGQGDLAPPACIGASKIEQQTLDLKRADLYAFIGSITPSDTSYLIIDAIKRLYEKRGNDVIIINTDGYMDRYGLTYKIKLIDTINPEIIACLGSYDYSRILLNRYRGKVYVADKPRYVEKDQSERILNRLARYKQFIGNGRRVFNITKKKVWLANNEYDCIIKDQYMLLEPFGPILHLSLLKDMYVALSIDDYVVGFGVIRDVSNIATLQTDYEGEFDTVMLSKIKLSSDLDKEYKVRYIL